MAEVKIDANFQFIKVLIAEDSEDDAQLVLRQLKKGGYKLLSKRIDCYIDMKSALVNEKWDLIITDHNMPGFGSAEALKLSQKYAPNIPFILVSGSIGEEIAVDAMKSGAHDYVMKENLSRLIPAIRRELREAKNRRDHKETLAKIKHMAFHDSLTGLKNRAEFEKQLLNVLHSNQKGIKHALLYIDLDQFKVVNDSCGHLAGDSLLSRLSKRLQECIRGSDTLARLGGDEFGVLLHNCSIDKAETIANQILTNIRDYVFIWGNRNFKVSASIGLIQINGNEKLTEILSLADMACYVAKDKGRNRIHMHTNSDQEIIRRRGDFEWLERLQNALQNNGLVLYHQKIKALQGGSSHRELLLRMLGENGEIISPDCFIPAAERYNLMPEIDRWVIRHACEQVSLMRAQNNIDELGLLFINLSATSLSDDGLTDYIQEQFIEFDLPAEQFGFEITETAAITDFDCALKLIKTLKKLGCKLALDDFGTGMSSFSYLKSLTVDFIKIDGSFVRSMLDDKIDQCFVEAVTNISHVAGMKCIAEFVETDAIQHQLTKLGVDFAQGYAIERPHMFTILKDSNK